MRVLDLGAAPGSWTLYVAKRVGLQGLVVAVDLKPFAQSFPANVIAIQADALQPAGNSWLQYAPYDLVLSDMAPNTSGSKVRDQALSFELFERALSVADQVAKPSSDFVAKLFMSDNFPAAKAALARAYTTVRVIRPDSTRQNSSELFLVGRGRR
jgi:23S rRNA (uridine2552-2'-O)-methyltransferase